MMECSIFTFFNFHAIFKYEDTVCLIQGNFATNNRDFCSLMHVYISCLYRSGQFDDTSRMLSHTDSYSLH